MNSLEPYLAVSSQTKRARLHHLFDSPHISPGALQRSLNDDSDPLIAKQKYTGNLSQVCWVIYPEEERWLRSSWLVSRNLGWLVQHSCGTSAEQNLSAADELISRKSIKYFASFTFVLTEGRERNLLTWHRRLLFNLVWNRWLFRLSEVLPTSQS